MEEDIKILEEMIKDAKDFEKQFNTSEIEFETEGQKRIQAIENLIARNKELEENLNYRVRYCNILEKELYGENSVELTKLEDKYFIPKSKIKEKIELIENVRSILPKRLYSPEEVAISTIKVLQELLD